MSRLLAVATLLTILPAGVSNGVSSPPPKGPPVPVKRPFVVGSAVEGRSITANMGRWRRATSYLLRWVRCAVRGAPCSTIHSARGLRYAITPRDVGKRLRVTVIARNDRGSRSVSSRPTPVVIRASTVFARTTFEDSVSLDPMNSSVWNQYQWLHNTDQVTGFGSRWGVLSVICSGSGSCPSSGVSTDYVNNSLVTLAGPLGASTRALKLAFTGSNPNSCCQQWDSIPRASLLLCGITTCGRG